jgi:hypothetical protein
VRGGVSEETEGCARILRVSEAEKARDDLDMSVERDVNRHEMLAPAIEQKDDECDEEMDRASGILLCHPGY